VTSLVPCCPSRTSFCPGFPVAAREHPLVTLAVGGHRSHGKIITRASRHKILRYSSNARQEGSAGTEEFSFEFVTPTGRVGHPERLRPKIPPAFIQIWLPSRKLPVRPRYLLVDGLNTDMDNKHAGAAPVGEEPEASDPPDSRWHVFLLGRGLTVLQVSRKEPKNLQESICSDKGPVPGERGIQR